MVYRYFFWIDGEEVEIYKNGLLYKFDGEKTYNYKSDIEGFWKKWEENSAFIPDGSQVDFVFIGKDKSVIEELKKYPETNYSWDKEGEFSFDDLKALLQDKPLKKFCVDTGEKMFFFQKHNDGYRKIAKDSSLEVIYVVGEGKIKDFNTQDDFSEEEIETSAKKSGRSTAFIKMFENNLKRWE